MLDTVDPVASVAGTDWADVRCADTERHREYRSIACADPGGAARNRLGELYWPDDEGLPAWVFPVRCVDPEDPDAIEDADPLAVVSTAGPVIDLLAFHPKTKGRWPLRLGLATVLGAIEPQYLHPPAATMHRCVVDWLRSGCSGIVLLTRDPIEAARVLRQCAAIEAEDPDHVIELRRVLAMPASALPEITVRTPRGGAI